MHLLSASVLRGRDEHPSSSLFTFEGAAVVAWSPTQMTEDWRIEDGPTTQMWLEAMASESRRGRMDQQGTVNHTDASSVVPVDFVLSIGGRSSLSLLSSDGVFRVDRHG